MVDEFCKLILTIFRVIRLDMSNKGLRELATTRGNMYQCKNVFKKYHLVYWKLSFISGISNTITLKSHTMTLPAGSLQREGEQAF